MTINMRRFLIAPAIAALLVFFLFGGSSSTTTTQAFRATPISVARNTSFLAAPGKVVVASRRRSASTTTGLRMFMGSDGGLLGVGTPEVFTVLLVGYFVLGPSDLYKLVKEIGKFVQNIRTLGTDLSTTLESNMESQLQLEELRKAQRELNDAFSFRRSINTDEASEAFSTDVTTPRAEEAAATAAAVSSVTTAENGTAKPKRKVRRRVKRKPDVAANVNGQVPPDLEMPIDTAAATKSDDNAAVREKYANRPNDPFIEEYSQEEKDLIDQEFDKYVSMGDDDDDDDGDNTKDSWFSESSTSSSSSTASSSSKTSTAAADPQMDAAATSRFQQQLSGNWNDQIMANQEQLEPLGKVMQLLASLEEEKIASTKRLEEEFRKRAEMEEEYYQKQRKVLEEAAQQVQASAAGKSSSSKA